MSPSALAVGADGTLYLATGAVTTGYRYDVLDRLDRVQRDGVTAQAFTYDLAGNRVSATSNAGIVTATFAVDDRIVTYDGNAITHDVNRPGKSGDSVS